MSASRVLVIGGYGVFGGRLTRRLVREPGLDVLVAGRSLARAKAHCDRFGGTPVELDTSGNLSAALRALSPSIVIDAAGPFQAYGADKYRVALAAIAAGAHCLDLADDPAFVAGIDDCDQAARAAGVAVISGCSSVPAISSAAVEALRDGLLAIDSIEAAIMPGNRAPRGLSVMRAILAQVGRPMQIWRGGQWQRATGWGQTWLLQPAVAGKAPLGRRPVSLIGAPDLLIFPRVYGARTVSFAAGLELGLMHHGLRVLSWLVRRGVVRDLTAWAPWLKWIADRLEPFGSDRGGMVVKVIGRRSDRAIVERCWTLIAEAGDGPEIPATPALLMVRKLLLGTVEPGARPCVGALSLDDVADGLRGYAIAMERDERRLTPLFEEALGAEFHVLPTALQRLHDVAAVEVFEGRSSVARGDGILARLLGWAMGFPAATPDIGVRVEMQRRGDTEVWRRTFGSRQFQSTLSLSSKGREGEVWERFGVLSFRIGLTVAANALGYPVTAGRAFGFVPLPRWLLPRSDTRETVDEHGRACFDVAISHPLAGDIVHYRGWLVPAGGSA
ncbi:MAG: DUF4166 domain-containing protein [Hyphomicrobiaceae bacterium]|nr:DUF4166 domain-containing protein [Hyphomicrobiaceae bacterium]